MKIQHRRRKVFSNDRGYMMSIQLLTLKMTAVILSFINEQKTAVIHSSREAVYRIQSQDPNLGKCVFHMTEMFVQYTSVLRNVLLQQ